PRFVDAARLSLQLVPRTWLASTAVIVDLDDGRLVRWRARCGGRDRYVLEPGPAAVEGGGGILLPAAASGIIPPVVPGDGNDAIIVDRDHRCDSNVGRPALDLGLGGVVHLDRLGPGAPFVARPDEPHVVRSTRADVAPDGVDPIPISAPLSSVDREDRRIR